MSVILPAHIQRLMRGIAPHGVNVVPLRRLRELEPYGWTGLTETVELQAWCQGRLGAASTQR